MENKIRKYTKKPGYKIFRKLSRKLGYDIIPLATKKIGQDPYLDMKKFIIKDNPLFLDVGANFGQTIDEFSEIFPDCRINSFEPSPTVYEFLRKKTSKMENVRIWNYGIGSTTKPLVLNENSNPNMSSFLEIGKDGWGSIENKTSVPMTTVDKFCQEQNIEKIDVLKIDTQGFEFEVLKGAEISMQDNKIGLLYFEVTFIEMYKELPSFGELYNLVINNGFELVTIYPIKYKDNLAGWTDVMFKHKNYNP